MAFDRRVGGISKRVRVRLVRAYCARCKQKQPFEETTVNHKFHLLLTILTGGLWLISWGAHYVGMLRRPLRCKRCGWRTPEIKE